MGCAKGDDANGAAAQGGAVSSRGRCDPVAGCWHPNSTLARSGEPLRCTPWYRSPGHDLRRAPYDHPDFTSNALGEYLFSASLNPVADRS